ncbi:MAG: hypothetical protein WCJ39_02920 [bacterium]
MEKQQRWYYYQRLYMRRLFFQELPIDIVVLFLWEPLFSKIPTLNGWQYALVLLAIVSYPLIFVYFSDNIDEERRKTKKKIEELTVKIGSEESFLSDKEIITLTPNQVKILKELDKLRKTVAKKEAYLQMIGG